MNKRKSLKELKGLILQDLAYQNDIIESFKGNDNPQIKEMYDNAVTRAETIKDILEYINNGSKFQFYKTEE